MRRFSDRMASLGCTVLDLMTSEISRLRGISSLDLKVSAAVTSRLDQGYVQTTTGSLINLLVQGAVGRGRPPASHHNERVS